MTHGETLNSVFFWRTFCFHKYSKLPLRTGLRKDLHATKGSECRGRATLCATFAAELDDQLPKIADSNNRIVQDMLISYFYKGLQPEYLREKISHFKVSNIKEVSFQRVSGVLYSNYGGSGEFILS